MKTYKHGISGVGITGLPGKKGKSGNSIYFGTVDSFFTYIGDNTLTDSSIDYDDIDYDITYALDELRLNYKFNEGDILYICSSTASDSSITGLVEITEDMTTCTKEYFLDNIKYTQPFTVNKHIYAEPVNIVDTTNTNASTNLYRLNDKYKSGFIKLLYADTTNDITDVSAMTNLNDDYYLKWIDTSVFTDIPIKYFDHNIFKKLRYVNNGKDINSYEFADTEQSVDLVTLITKKNTINLQCKIIALKNTGIDISVNTGKFYIDNLYIKSYNYGNIDAYNTLYYSDLLLDSNGNCYTLSSTDYDASTLSFTIDTSSFFKTSNFSLDDYKIGYTHMYWNYNDTSYNAYTGTNQYMSNYERGTLTSDYKVNKRSIVTDSYGSYVRNWADSSYLEVDNITVRQLLINMLDTSHLWNMRYKIFPSNGENLLTEEQYDKYWNYKGIIKTVDSSDYITYNYILNNKNILYLEYIDNLDSSLFELYDMNKVNPGTESRLNAKINIDLLTNYIDTSFYSGMDNITDPSTLTISLTLEDPTASLYRHHNIFQYIIAPNGLKYYSKLTEAHFNYATNSYDISTDWIKPAINENYNESLEDNGSLFNITFTDSSIIVDINLDDELIIDISILENGTNIEESTINTETVNETEHITSVYAKYNKYVLSINSEDRIYNTNILKDIYDSSDLNTDTIYNLYTIQYNIYGESPYSSSGKYNHIYTYNKAIDGYTEVRTLPVINLKTYNSLKDLEELNDANNGILCNQFQTFTDINISDFTYDDWGSMQSYIKEPKLIIKFNKGFFCNNLNNTSATLSEENQNTITNNGFNISWTLLKPDVDIFTASLAELSDENNIKETTGNGDYEFTIDEALSGTYHLRMFIETANPEPECITSQIYVSGLSIKFTNNNGVETTYTLPLENGCVKNELNVLAKNKLLYQSDLLKLAIAPISYIAAYELSSNKISNINSVKWFGSSDKIQIATIPYKMSYVEDNYSVYSTTRTTDWNAIKYKPRYFQDNIQSLHILTENINSLADVIPDTIYNSSVLANDQDDIYNTYLQVVYNSSLLNPLLIDDELKIVYNNEYYSESEYGQFGNNTAVYIKQETEVPVRSQTLLSSMQVWNDLYEHSTHYASDNPYTGMTETYGNGYQYLPKSIDTGQYLKDSIMSLEDMKSVNNQILLDSSTYIEEDINSSEKNDMYTPSILFRSLLYQLEWSYPCYDTSMNLNIIHQLPLTTATLVSDKSVRSGSDMPYNLCYNIYPRMMFNDEEQYNVVMMLRRPSIIRENQYKMSYTDSCLTITSETLNDLTDPLNVFN